MVIGDDNYAEHFGRGKSANYVRESREISKSDAIWFHTARFLKIFVLSHFIYLRVSEKNRKSRIVFVACACVFVIFL
jgi:hypothetical protein